MTGVQGLATILLVAVVLTPPKRQKPRSRIVWHTPLAPGGVTTPAEDSPLSRNEESRELSDTGAENSFGSLRSSKQDASTGEVNGG